MSVLIAENKFAWKIIATDVIIITLVYLVPLAAHVAPFPLYYADPMRLLLFTGYVLSKNRSNAFFLALSLPLVSTIISGHPPFYKALLISIELFANMYLLFFLIKKVNWHKSIVILVSIVASKILYYLLKFVFIKYALVQGDLFATGIWIQIALIIPLSILLSFLLPKAGKK